MPPKIFVVTVCRNAATLLEQTIQSVLAQSYADVEYILVDGASTDGTQQIIEQYASARDSRIVYWVSEPDKGIYDAMNKALGWIGHRLQADPQSAQNAWVNFMNAGDRFADDEVLWRIFGPQGCLYKAKEPAAVKVIGGTTIDLYPNGSTKALPAEPAEVIPTRLPFSHQASLVRVGQGAPQVDLKDGHWQFDRDYPIAADYNLFYQIYWKHGAGAFLTVDQPVACYRREGSTSLDNAKRTKGEYLAIQASHLSWRWVKEYLKWRWL